MSADLVSQVMSAMGRKGGKIGGKATGARKARTPEQCRAAALTRWRKVKTAKAS